MKAKKLIVLTLLAILLLATFACDDGEELEAEGLPTGPPTCGESCFVVFGDPRVGHRPFLAQLLYPEDKFGLLTDQVNDTGAKIAFITGDLYWVGPDPDEYLDNGEDSTEEEDEFLEAVANLKAQWYPVMGNHEAIGEHWAVTRELIFRGQSTYYSFDHGDSHFIVLDAYMPGAWSSISEEQMAWLEADLRATAKPHIFVFVHPPLYPTGPHLGESLDTDIEVRDRLAALLTEHQVDAVFCGHEHFYCSFEYRGLMQVTTGGAGAQPLSDYEEFDELEEEYGYHFDEITRWKAVKAFHYVVVEVKGDKVEIAAYGLEGYLIDQFSLSSKRALSLAP